MTELSRIADMAEILGAIIFIGLYMQFTWVGWAGIGIIILCGVAGFGFALSSRRPLG